MVETFGVVSQYYRTDEMAAYFPDLWTLVKYIGASRVRGAVRRWAADQAAQNGIKIHMTYTGPWVNPDKPGPFASQDAIKAYLDGYNISQYRDHPGVFGHEITAEPCMGYSFDPQNPSAALLNLISVFKYACDYVRSLDPTHPVWIGLDSAPAYYEDPAGTYIAKRKAWINLFIDFCDVLEYHYYLQGSSGSEYWRDPEGMRTHLITNLDQVLIPSSKGKPIIIGETGCPAKQYTDYAGKIATYTEQQQADYFRIYGEETKKRGILVCVYKLIDATLWDEENDDWGLFRSTNDGTMNIRKVAAGLVKDYLSITPTPLPTLTVSSTPIGVPFTIALVTLTGTLTVDTSPVVGAIYVNGTYVGDGHYSASVAVGSYTVSFGSVSGYATPSAQTVTVSQNLETKVVGTYVLPVNLLLNPSVENGVTSPYNWTSFKTTNMTATLSWVSDAHTGVKALRIDATLNSLYSANENALWRQSVAVTEGKTYRFRAWYKNAVGDWTGPCRLILLAGVTGTRLELPPSSIWTQSEWLSITIPSGVTELLADARIFNLATGYAVFDDFELMEVV